MPRTEVAMAASGLLGLRHSARGRRSLAGVLRQALQLVDRRGAEVDMVADDGDDLDPLAGEGAGQLLDRAVARAGEVGRDQEDDDVGGVELGLDRRVPAAAGLQLAVVEGDEAAGVAQPAQVVEDGVPPGASSCA